MEVEKAFNIVRDIKEWTMLCTVLLKCILYSKNAQYMSETWHLVLHGSIRWLRAIVLLIICVIALFTLLEILMYRSVSMTLLGYSVLIYCNSRAWAPTGMGKGGGHLPMPGKVEKCYRLKTPSPKSV